MWLPHAHPASSPAPACRSGWVGIMAVAVKWLDLIGWEMVLGAGLGVLWGVGLATAYRWNLKRKNDRRQLVGGTWVGPGGPECGGRVGCGSGRKQKPLHGTHHAVMCCWPLGSLDSDFQSSKSACPSAPWLCCAAVHHSGRQGHAGAAAPHPYLDFVPGNREDGGEGRAWGPRVHVNMGIDTGKALFCMLLACF